MLPTNMLTMNSERRDTQDGSVNLDKLRDDGRVFLGCIGGDKDASSDGEVAVEPGVPASSAVPVACAC